MHLFRKLAGNIFFKIILFFVALTFVLFGISGFLLGNPNSWVAKVGNSTITQNTFNKALQSDRDVILASNKSKEAAEYLESGQFKSGVLGRLINRIMIEKLHNQFGVSASRKLILESIAKDQNFKNKDGKFDHEVFKNFLAKNGFNEEKYINEIANDVVASMIIQTLPMAAPINVDAAIEMANFKQEKRLADLVTISTKNVGTIAKASDVEIEKFFAENKQNYLAPEMRTVSYLHFSKSNFSKDFQISDAELVAEYEKNKDQFLKPEQRTFYHTLFEDEASAKGFLERFNGVTKIKEDVVKSEFAKLAKSILKKDLKAITFTTAKKDLVPELAEPIFKLAINQHSDVLKSPLGFHIFLLVDLKPASSIPFAELRESIKHKLLQDREEKVVQGKISEIDDMILTSNSIVEVSKKFDLKSGNVTLNQDGFDVYGKEISAIKGFEGFAKNAFAAAQGQASKIFYSVNSDGFYAIKVEKIEVAHDKKLEEVKSQLIADLTKKKQSEALHVLATKISDELKSNPNSLSDIAKKYKLKVEKSREFPRVYYADFQGRKVPYQNKFLGDLFSIKIGQATPASPSSEEEFVIGVLREIKKSSSAEAQVVELQQQAEEEFRGEILQEFNNYLLAENPVKVNEKILEGKAAK